MAARRERDFQHAAMVAYQAHATTYGVVNVLLVAIWWMTGHHYFWPMWPAVGWGTGLGIHSWLTFGRPHHRGS